MEAHAARGPKARWMWAGIGLVLIAGARTEGATRRVPADFPTIQLAIDASETSGDTVLVSPGTYVENIEILHKDIVLLSAEGPEITIIDGSQPSNPDTASVAFLLGVGIGGKTEGFTMRGGAGAIGVISGVGTGGGGICIVDSIDEGPTIQGNWILHNMATRGGGVLVAGAARVLGNRIAFNTAEDGGGGIGIFESGLPTSTPRRLIADNEIFLNQASSGGGIAYVPFNGGAGFDGVDILGNVVACNQAVSQGGGMRVSGHPGSTRIEGNTIFGNWSQQLGGAMYLWVLSGNQLEVQGNVVVYNLGGNAVDCSDLPGPQPMFTCNDIFGNQPTNSVGEVCGEVLGLNNNFSLDPAFGSADCAPTEPYHFCLLSGSPLLPENSPPGCGLIGARGACAWVGIEVSEPTPRADPAVLPAQPNPFAERTAMPIDLPEAAEIRVQIVNARGAAVIELTPGRFPAGEHRVTWDGRDARGRRCPAGVYFARMQAGERQFQSRLLLLR